jgi:hypothetical protein
MWKALRKEGASPMSLKRTERSSMRVRIAFGTDGKAVLALRSVTRSTHHRHCAVVAAGRRARISVLHRIACFITGDVDYGVLHDRSVHGYWPVGTWSDILERAVPRTSRISPRVDGTRTPPSDTLFAVAQFRF